MSRDFARSKKKGNKKQNRKKNQPEKSVNVIKWLIAGLALGFGLAFFLYLVFSHQNQSEPTKNSKQPYTEKSKEKYPAVEPPSKSDYEFWELLKNKKVQVSNDKTQMDQTQSEKSYVMQCGSFKKLEMAQSLKAKIAMSGLSASIHTTQEKDGYRWNRVVLGPYVSKRKAESNRHRLEDNGINGCQIW